MPIRLRILTLVLSVMALIHSSNALIVFYHRSTAEWPYRGAIYAIASVGFVFSILSIIKKKFDSRWSVPVAITAAICLLTWPQLRIFWVIESHRTVDSSSILPDRTFLLSQLAFSFALLGTLVGFACWSLSSKKGRAWLQSKTD